MKNERPELKVNGSDQSEPRFNRTEIKERFKLELIKVRDNFFNSANDANSVANDAEGAMQSHSDTTKAQQSWLANALGGLGKNLDRVLADWDVTFPKEFSDKIGLGSIVFLKELGYGDEEWFYLMPFGGGISIKIGDEEIKGLNIESVLGRNLSGGEKGQQVEYQAHPNDTEIQRFRILEVL